MEQKEISQELNPLVIKKFLRHAFLVGRKIRERDVAKESLKTHLEQFKNKIIETQKNKRTIARDFDELNRKIDSVLEKEARLIKYQQVDADKIEMLKDSLVEINKKMDNLMKVRHRKGKRKQ